MKTIRFLAAVSGAFLVLGFGNQAFAQYCGGSDSQSVCDQNRVNRENEQRMINDEYYRNQNSGGSQNSTRASKPKVVIVNKYGAVTVNKKTGMFDSAFGESTKKLAVQNALKRCGSRFCYVFFTYSNQCAAVTWGDGTLFRGLGMTSKEAESASMNSCQSSQAKTCKILMPAECSL